MSNVLESVLDLLQGFRQPAPALAPVPNPSGDGEVAVVADGYHVERMEGRTVAQRVHAFDDLASFARWLNRHGEPEKAEVLMAGTVVCASLDPTSVRGDCVTCSLDHHPLFASWRSAVELPTLTQHSFYHLLREAGDTLDPTVRDSLIGQLQKLVVTQSGTTKSEIDPTGYVRFQATDGKQDFSGKIPPFFEIRTPIIESVLDENEEPRRYPMNVIVQMTVSDGKPIFQLSCPELPLAVRQARRDAADYLCALLDKGFEVGLGTFDTNVVPAGS